MNSNKSKKLFIDLFAGCGGLSLGLEQAGFTPLVVNELNRDAMNTYLLNREDFPWLKKNSYYDIKELIDYTYGAPNYFRKKFKSLEN